MRFWRGRVPLLESALQDRIEHLETRRHGPPRRERLEHGERRGHRDAAVDQELHQRAELRPVGVHLGQGGLAGALSRTLVGLLVLHEVGGGEEAVLQVVDAELRGLPVGHRTEVPGELHPPGMGCLERGAQLRPGDVHVRLERRRAGVGPEVDHAACVIGARERVHLVQRQTGPFQVGRRRVDPRAGLAPFTDGARDLQLAVPVHVAGRAHGGDAAGQVQPCEALGQVAVDARARWGSRGARAPSPARGSRSCPSGP